MATVASLRQLVMEQPHQLGGGDIDRVLIPEGAALHPNEKSGRFQEFSGIFSVCIPALPDR